MSAHPAPQPAPATLEIDPALWPLLTVLARIARRAAAAQQPIMPPTAAPAEGHAAAAFAVDEAHGERGQPPEVKDPGDGRD